MNPFNTKLSDEEYTNWLLRLIADGHNTRSAKRHIKRKLKRK